MALVTTVIPVFNGERFLEPTLESVGRQTRPPDQLIILDNCSTDSTPLIVQRFKQRYPKLNCVWRGNETNIGGLANFNRALDFAPDTDYLHILSADDLIKPQFFERLLPELDDVPGRAVVYCLLDFINDQGETIPPFQRETAGPARVLPLDRFLAQQSELRHIYCQSIILKTARQPMPVHFRSDWLQAADVIFYSEWATHCERIVEVPEALCEYRMHAASTTGGNIMNLQAWVLEEWRAMRTVADMMPEKGLRRWLRLQKQSCIFAARSTVKIQIMRKSRPGYAADIREATQRIVNPVHWLLGNLAVGLRDTARYLRGEPNPNTSQQAVH